VRIGLSVATAVSLAACRGGVAPAPSREPVVPTSVTSTGPGSPSSLVSPSSDAPPTEPGVEAVVSLSGNEAYGLAVTDDSVWVVLYRGSILSRVDPDTNKEIDTIDGGAGAATLLTVGDRVWLGRYGSDPSITVFDEGDAVLDVDAGELCCDLTELSGIVWGVDADGALVGIDRTTGGVTKRVNVPLHSEIHTNVVAGGNALWASSDDTPLFRVDARGRITKRIRTGGGVPFLEHDGLVWGAKPDELWAVDAKTSKVARRIQLDDSFEVLSMAIDDDSIWLGMRHPGFVGAVERLDLESGKVLAEIRVDIPARIALAFGSVWVTDSGGGSLYRVDPGATTGA